MNCVQDGKAATGESFEGGRAVVQAHKPTKVTFECVRQLDSAGSMCVWDLRDGRSWRTLMRGDLQDVLAENEINPEFCLHTTWQLENSQGQLGKP